MKILKILNVLIFSVFIVGCAYNQKNFHRIVQISQSNNDAVDRFPSGNEDFYSADELKKKKPLEILEMLKNDCCQTKLMETIETKGLWTEEDLVYIKEYLSDNETASSVSKSTSNIDCHGEKFQSTVHREAMHLIMAYKLGFYPVSQCSTIDLKID